MKHGYIRVAAATPLIRVADCRYNTDRIIEIMTQAYDKKAKVVVFPELCITGYTCNDLFLHEILLTAALEGLKRIIRHSVALKGMISFVGLPYEYSGKLYNVAAAVCDGKLLGFVPKRSLPNYGEFYERRQFTPGFDKCVNVDFDGYSVPLGAKMLFTCVNMPQLVIGAEICEDLWTPQPPSSELAMNGATLLVNCSASNETVGKKKYRQQLVSGQSARLVAAYVLSLIHI